MGQNRQASESGVSEDRRRVVNHHNFETREWGFVDKRESNRDGTAASQEVAARVEAGAEPNFHHTGRIEFL